MALMRPDGRNGAGPSLLSCSRQETGPLTTVLCIQCKIPLIFCSIGIVIIGADFQTFLAVPKIKTASPKIFDSRFLNRAKTYIN